MLGTVTDLLAYAAIPIVVGITGYILGWESCVLTHHQHEHLGAALMSRGTPPTSSTATPDDPPLTTHDEPPRRRRVAGLDLGVVGYILAALALVVAGFTAYQGQAQDRARVGCFNSYANQVADALDARQIPAAKRNAAITRVFTVVAHAFEDPKHPVQNRRAFRKSIDHYLAADARLAKRQERNPYPEPPRVVCPS